MAWRSSQPTSRSIAGSTTSSASRSGRAAGESDDWWDGQADPGLAVGYLTRLFESPEVCSTGSARPDRSGPLVPGRRVGPPRPAARARRGAGRIDGAACWRSSGLYARLFAPVCTNHLGHLDRGPEAPDPLNSACYMWWDLFPTWGERGGDGRSCRSEAAGRERSGRRRAAPDARGTAPVLPPGSADGPARSRPVDEAILRVLGETLELDSEPCREGALHGLGHWYVRPPRPRVRAIIDQWLGTAGHGSAPSSGPVRHQRPGWLRAVTTVQWRSKP